VVLADVRIRWRRGAAYFVWRPDFFLMGYGRYGIVECVFHSEVSGRYTYDVTINEHLRKYEQHLARLADTMFFVISAVESVGLLNFDGG